MKNQKKPKITKKTLKGTKKTNKTNISDTYRLKVWVREAPKQKEILVFHKKPKGKPTLGMKKAMNPKENH